MTRRLGLPCWLLLGLATMRAGAETATTERSPEPDKPAPGPMSFTITDLAIEATEEFEQRRVRTHFGGWSYRTRQRNRTQRVEQIGRIGFETGTRNPDIFQLTGTLGLGYSQERFTEDFDNRHGADDASGFLSEYDLRADLFKASKVSGSVFGLQTSDRYARPFLPSLHEHRTEYGTSWNFNDDVLPMELRAEHHDTVRDGSRKDYDNEHVQEDNFGYTATWNHLPNHTLKLDVDYNDRHERYSGSARQFDTQRTELRLDDELQFGADRQHRLDTTMRYEEERGDLDRDLLEMGPRLTLQHSQDLSTHYQYQYSREQVGQLDVDMHRGDVGFVHQVFTNLTTTGNFFGLHEQVEDDLRTNEFGSDIDWAYTRNNKLGVFSSDLGLTHEFERAYGGGSRVQLHESGTFRDPLPIILSRPGVFLPSVMVWNSTRTRRYILGFDYIAVRSRDRVLLFRRLLGRIANRESVSIDYAYYEDRDAQRSTTRTDFRVQQQFDSGWTPYYAMEFQDEDRDSDLSRLLRENNINRHRVGLKYAKPRISYGIELEVLKDSIDPFIAYRAFVERNFLTKPLSSLDGRVDFSQYFFDRPEEEFWHRSRDREVVLVEASLDGRHQLTMTTDAYGQVRYRYQDDEPHGITHGVDAEAGTEIHWGQYTVSASVEYNLLNIVDSHEDGFGVWVKVRRDFTELLGKR